MHNIPTRPTLWRPRPQRILCNAADKQFEDCGAARARCVTPTPMDLEAPPEPARRRAIDRKMQHEWREDMLAPEKRNRLQAATDRLLGKPNAAPPSHVSIPGPDIGSDLTLPPIVVPAPDRPPGPDPFLVPTPQLSRHDTHKVCVGVDPCTPCLVPSTLKPVIPSRRAEGMHPG
jgi:hypothetical protein